MIDCSPRACFVYNYWMEASPLTGEFRPELLSRRGETLAWLTALLSFSAWTILSFMGRPVLSVVPFMSFFFLFAAASISLGNWVDRHTLLHLDENGVGFRNGLRNVYLSWSQILQIQVFGSKWGRKVRVLGEESHFDFRTLGELTMAGEVKGRMGFLQGEQILRQVLTSSGLREVEHSDNNIYYARV
ncbi:MAG: hypothetical protein H6Q37_2090 [Chloroflexi bacterium]|nr:hypothetical protein [Chloroflexota bacterium]